MSEENGEKWRPFSPQSMGEYIEGSTGYAPDWWEAAAISQFFNGELEKQIKEGGYRYGPN